MKFTRMLLLALLWAAMLPQGYSQKKKSNDEPSTDKSALAKTSLSGLKFRSVGPAITSGRISDFAINPDSPKEYYVAVSSGGVWKTENAGTTFQPIFDSQGSYSIGCVTLDPNNPEVVWVGTGENNNQRSVAYGDGVYKSTDGGKSWEKMGLDNSEHIGKIIVDPRNSDVVYVAAIGPLWSSGGDRGLYKTTDGGKTWNAMLTVDEHTGINDVVMDPRNPDILYASAHQRRRHVFTYISGGPGSGMYKSTDGGANWAKINKGLPSVDIGRIGLTISPANPEMLYAIVEAADGKGGFFRSTDRGASWEKRSGHATSGNYYQEIIADPNNPDKIFSMDTWMSYSTDGGKNFEMVGEVTKHVDNHCIWIDPTDSDHFLVGCDGGIYETWDHADTWHFKGNLPVTQFYKVSVDNSEPFYYIYGGTQDNFSMGGPSRTVSGNGIENADWFMTHGGDGFESQPDPENPDIIYAQSQYGFLVRYDRKSGEELGIKPQPRKGEDAYRWNWDAPLVASQHQGGRLYFAANKVFQSDDRGNSWQVISDDLTQQINRNELEVMGRVWSMDAVMKNGSTSPYGTIVALAESPIQENLLMVGTDDGLVQITEDGGENWRKVSNFPSAPSRSYVNAVCPSAHDENVMYVALNHHKYGDFKPYLFKSTDKGQTWQAIANNLPERGSVYAIAEDHVDPNLLFVGTEFGVFFSNDGGNDWVQLKAGLPTIAVRDIAIQRWENDLVLGTFGRGFYVLDDYSVLRNFKGDVLEKEAGLFAIRDALLFEASYPYGLPKKAFQGDAFYQGDNLPSVAIFTYFLKDDIKTREELRQEREKENKKEGKDNPYPTYEQLKAEVEEEKPYLLFTVKNAAGDIVAKQTASPSKGLQRFHWDMRHPSKDAISLSKPSFYNPFGGKDEGSLVAPGTYTVTLSKSVDGEISELAGPVSFEVKALNNTTLPAQDRQALVAFQQEVQALSSKVQAVQRTLSEMGNELKHIREAVKKMQVEQGDMMQEVYAIEDQIRDIQTELNGDRVASRLDIDRPATVSDRIGLIGYEMFYSTSTPTKTHRDSYAIAKEEFAPILDKTKALLTGDFEELKAKLVEAGAPYTPNRIPGLPRE